MKALSGKKYFYAAGQRDASRLLPMNPRYKKQHPGCWPSWAKNAYIAGYYGLY